MQQANTQLLTGLGVQACRLRDLHAHGGSQGEGSLRVGEGSTSRTRRAGTAAPCAQLRAALFSSSPHLLTA